MRTRLKYGHSVKILDLLWMGQLQQLTTGFQLKAGEPPVILFVGYGEIVLKMIEESATATLQYQFLSL